MKNITKWYLLITGAGLGFLWNLLCLLGVLPLEKWPFTFVFTAVFCAVGLLPVWFSKRFPKDEKPPKGRNDAPKNEKAAAVVMGCITFAWLITVAACIVCPL